MKYKNMSNEEARAVIRKGVEIAQKARKISKSELKRLSLNSFSFKNLECLFNLEEDSVLVAGSVGPLGAIKCDLSEYDGSYANEYTLEVCKGLKGP